MFEIMMKKFIIEAKWLFDMDSQARQQEKSSRAAQHSRQSLTSEGMVTK